MTTNNSDVFDALCSMLAGVGYTFHDNLVDAPETLDDDEPRGHWFAWAAPRMPDCETGDTHAEFSAAVLEAAAHWFANAHIQLEHRT